MKILAALFCSLILATAFADDPAKFSVGAYEFSRPADWKWIQPTSPMRKAQLQIPGKDGGRPADITFFFFGEGNGGGRDAGQFCSPQGPADDQSRHVAQCTAAEDVGTAD